MVTAPGAARPLSLLALLLLLAMGAAHAAASLLPATAHASRHGADGWVLRAARPEQRRGGVVSVRLWWRPPEPPAAGAAFLVTWEEAAGALRGNLVTQASCATLSLQPRTVFRVQVSVLHGAAVSSSRPLVVDTGRALQLQQRLTPQEAAAAGGSSWPDGVFLSPTRAAHAPTPATLVAVAAAALLAALAVVSAALCCLSSSCRRPKAADPWPTRVADEHTGLCVQPVRAPQGMPPQTGSAEPESDRNDPPVPTLTATATSSREAQSAGGVSWLPLVELNMSTDWVNAF